MKTEQLQKFKTAFLTQKQALVSKSLEDRIDEGSDEMDIVQNASINSMLDSLSMRDKDMVRKLNNALKKIEEGTFGLCEDCEEPIAEKRLNALPHAVLCVFCAEAKEKEAKHYVK